MLPEDMVVNWALGLFVEKTGFTATEMKGFVNLSYVADHEIRNWDISNLAFSWKRTLLQNEVMIPADGPKRIAIFSAYHQVTTMYLALAMVFLRKGHIVDLVLIARGNHDATPDRKWERCLVDNELRYLQKTLAVENLTIHRIEDYPKSALDRNLSKIVDRQSLEDLQQSVHSPFPNYWKRKVRRIHRYRKRMNGDFGKRFLSFARQHQYDHWLVDSGAWAEYGVAYGILESLGIDRVCPACKVEKGHIVVSRNRKFSILDTNAAWQAELKIDGRQVSETQLMDQMREREDPVFYEKYSNYQFQRATKLETSELYERLGLDSSSPMVLMLPNVDCDTSVLSEHAHRAFNSMREWAFETIRFFIRYPELQLVVRGHPGEHYSGLIERIGELIVEEFPNLPMNIHILDSDTDLNTYALMYSSDLVLTYTSDVGWESVVRNIPAICGGKAHFSDYGFVMAPNTKAEYLSLLLEFADKPAGFKVSNAQRNQALIYADLYSNIIPKPFPWSQIRAFESLAEQPLEYVLSDEGLAEYEETFDLLSGERIAPAGIVGRIPPPAHP
jgi:hypothetical protein